MKKVVSIIIAMSILVSMVTVAQATENPFVDVNEDAWYHDEVVKAVETGIINGKSATEFKPDDLLTYAEAVKLAACMNQVYSDGVVTLSAGEPWYKPYADFCVENNITIKDYDYNANATRAGYMEIFANALPKSAFTEINNIPDGSIPDVNLKASYAIYVYKMYRAGIVTGVDALHNCNPDDNIKRAEVAAIISRMMDENKRQKFDMSESKGELKNEGTVDSDKTEDTDKIPAKINEFESDDDPVLPDNVKINGHESVEVKTEPDDDPVLPDNVKINGHESVEVKTEPDDDPIISDTPVNYGNESVEIVILPTIEVTDNTNIDITTDDYTIDMTKGPLAIEEQPKGTEEENYGSKYELYVKVTGGKMPYTYKWQYNGYRNQKTKIENGDYAKDADSEALVLSVEKENNLLGVGISCVITDSEGTVVTTDTVKVYGPFSMIVEESLNDSGNYILTGRISDGIIRKGDKVSVERNGKIIAIGVAVDLQMFGKSLDEGIKGDNIGIVFDLDKGVRPTSGDVVIKHKDTHVIDTSDIVN